MATGVLVAGIAVGLSVSPPEKTGDTQNRPDEGLDTNEVRDPPAIEVLWRREGADVVVTFTRVDSPTPLDCRWLATAYDRLTGAQRGWTNFTDRQAWMEHPSCRYAASGDTDSNMVLTDRDEDHKLSAADYITIRSIAPGEESTLILDMAYWGSWLFRFSWTDPSNTAGI